MESIKYMSALPAEYALGIVEALFKNGGDPFGTKYDNAQLAAAATSEAADVT